MKKRLFLKEGLEIEWEQCVLAQNDWLIDIAIRAMEMAAAGSNKNDLDAYLNQCKLEGGNLRHVKNLVRRFSPRGEELFGLAA